MYGNNLKLVEDLTAQLLVQKKEIAHQKRNKEKRASELLIANKELAFQNKEKEKRASELLIANKELAFQNEEKEKRASELLIANNDLIFQSQEKIKRAAELLVAHKEIEAQAKYIEIQKSYYIEKQLLAKTLACIGDAVISTDQDNNVALLNKVAESLTGWTQVDAIGVSIYKVLNIINENTRKEVDIVNTVLKTGVIHNLANHTILIKKDGKELLIEDSAGPIFDEENNIVGAVIVFRDYTEKRERLKKIEYLSFHDDLTGIYNRRYYEEELNRLDTNRNLPLSLIMGDVNGLKLINDSFGHGVGDQLLKNVALAIKKGCRADDIIARLGGDEFVVILPKSNAEDAAYVVDRIKGILREENKWLRGFSFLRVWN